MKMKISEKIIKPSVWSWMKWVLVGLFCFLLLTGFFFGLPKCLSFLKDNAFVINQDTPIDTYGQMGDSYGIFNALFSGLAFVGVILTLFFQWRDNRKRTVVEQFYKMLEVQQKVISEITVSQVRRAKKDEEVATLKGRKAFVEYKIQLKYLFKAIKKVSIKGGFDLSDIDIADISYSVFFYGSAPSWKPFMMEYLKDYSDTERMVDLIIDQLNAEKNYILSRPNQNYLSVYFRNMYNAIKLIDGCSYLNKKEKEDNIKMLRLQLSNAELYVLFFNIISRFGKKWVEKDYISKYQLIQNLPSKYCDGYNPKDFFPTINFESDELSLSPFKEKIVKREKDR